MQVFVVGDGFNAFYNGSFGVEKLFEVNISNGRCVLRSYILHGLMVLLFCPLLRPGKIFLDFLRRFLLPLLHFRFAIKTDCPTRNSLK